MAQRNDGGSAFPSAADTAEGHAMKDFGMSLRDYFAAKAMQGLLSNPVAMEKLKANDPDGSTRSGAAVYAYQVADAMLAEREN